MCHGDSLRAEEASDGLGQGETHWEACEDRACSACVLCVQLRAAGVQTVNEGLPLSAATVAWLHV